MHRRRHETHSAAFREEAIRQARARGDTQSLKKVADDLGVKYSTLRLWLKEAEAATEEDHETEESELRRLRREVRELRVEREILKKAMAFFAKHTR
jgi:transposase